MDQATCLAFQGRARLSRGSLGVDTPALRPISATQHVNNAVPGFVGTHYRTGGLCLLSVNPAGGKDDYQPTEGDGLVYDAAAALARANAGNMLAELECMGRAFVSAMPSWGSQWRHVNAILSAAGLSLDRIAYIYLLPFRTKGDLGSKLGANVLKLATQSGFHDLIDSLRPERIIAMDRPSEKAARDWAAKRAGGAEVLYYTRKRDDHVGRAEFLKQLRAAS